MLRSLKKYDIIHTCNVLQLRITEGGDIMAEKIFGAFYTVNKHEKLNFEKTQAFNLVLDKCGKGELAIKFSDKEDEFGFHVGGHAEQHNLPIITIYNHTNSVRIVLEQEDLRAEGLLHLTLVLPKKKYGGLTVTSQIMDIRIEGGEFDFLNLSNKKGYIEVDTTSQNVAIHSRYYPVQAIIRLVARGLIQIGSRTGDVNLNLLNAGKVNVLRKPQDSSKYICQGNPVEHGYLVDVYLNEKVEGLQKIQIN